MPSAPARAVRPMRWTYCSGTSGRSKLKTWLTPGMSIPRAAMSVAISTGTWPDLKAAMRPLALRLPLVAVDRVGGDAGGAELADDLVGAMLGAAEHQRPLDRARLEEQGQQRRLFGLVDDRSRVWSIRSTVVAAGVTATSAGLVR